MSSGALEDRVVLVTGASEGLGAELARAASAAGARVVLTARREQLLVEVAAQLGEARVVPGDVTVEGDRQRIVESAIDAYGRVDVLVNNAAVAAAGPAADEPLSTVEDTMAANLTSVLRLCQLMAPGMLARRRGSIVNVASISALRSFDRFGLASYAASKAGVLGLTRELAAQWGAAGVRVNALAPGCSPEAPTATCATTSYVTGSAGTPRSADQDVPEELASVMVFLASDASSYITGQTLSVDGGSTAF